MKTLFENSKNTSKNKLVRGLKRVYFLSNYLIIKDKWFDSDLRGELEQTIADAITYDNYRDKNDYKRAWKTLIEIQPSEEAKQTHQELLRLHRRP